LVADILSQIAGLILFILPAYFANSTPVLLGGGLPIDLGRKFFDGERLFGDGKTMLGFFAGVSAGFFIGALEAYFIFPMGFVIYPDQFSFITGGFLLGLGTMTGDLLGSFLKRRMKVKRGRQSLLLDQLSFLIFALLFSLAASPAVLSFWGVLFLFVATYFVHAGANVVANKTGLKKVPW
jgi:CDP-2,3-bis-(O-geranylgeranyl)-sn-glycerol synthase